MPLAQLQGGAMTAICVCDLRRSLQLPLEFNGSFYCGGCGGLFEGKRAQIAKEMWEHTARINNEFLGRYTARLRRPVKRKKGRKRI
jgi:hypothetical protein